MGLSWKVAAMSQGYGDAGGMSEYGGWYKVENGADS